MYVYEYINVYYNFCNKYIVFDLSFIIDVTNYLLRVCYQYMDICSKRSYCSPWATRQHSHTLVPLIRNSVHSVSCHSSNIT